MFENDKVILLQECSRVFLKGYVMGFDDEVMIVRMVTSNRFPLNTYVNIFIYNRVKGEVIYKGKIDKINRNIIKLTDITAVKVNQRRSEARVDVSLELIVSKIWTGFDQCIELEKKIPMKTVNLSSSGVLLYSELDMPENVLFHLELPINDTVINCCAEVVRKEKKEDGYYYGCKLVMLEEAEQSKIREFVFKKQIENRRKNMHTG